MRELVAGQLQAFIHPTRDAMGAAAAADAADAISRALKQRGEARVILASAPSQLEVLHHLTRTPLDWSRVTLFHMDEYVGLPGDHPASFRRFQHQHVLPHISPRAFHEIQGDAPNPDAECARYAALLMEGPIDLVCLGIGENGHLAFNDPPVADFADSLQVKQVELEQRCREQQVHDGCFASLDLVPRFALTLTIPALLRGEHLVCTVPGLRKAQAVRDTLQHPLSTACPATILREHASARLYLDTQAATLLQ